MPHTGDSTQVGPPRSFEQYKITAENSEKIMPAIAIPAAFAHHIRTAREMVDERRRAPEEEYFATACPAFDRLLEGGLQRGEMVELVGGRSSGRFSLVLMALAAATQVGEAAALVDLGDGFDPQAATAMGVDMERLLWVRPRRTKEALLSAEAILDCGIPLLVLDLGMPPIPGGRGAEAFWLRLQRRALARRAALLVTTPYRATGTAPRTVLRAQEVGPRWHGRGLTPRLLAGLDTRLERVKQRHVRGDVHPEGLALHHPELVSATPSDIVSQHSPKQHDPKQHNPEQSLAPGADFINHRQRLAPRRAHHRAPACAPAPRNPPGTLPPRAASPNPAAHTQATRRGEGLMRWPDF
jgi:hypothetical protein